MDEKIARACPARHSCKQHGILCSSACPLFVEIRYQLALSHIPRRHRKFTVDTLPDDTIRLSALQKYNANLLDRVRAGQGLYLHGNTGSGKTTALCAVGMSYIVEASKAALRTGVKSQQFVEFINVADMLNGIKQGFDDPAMADYWNKTLTAASKVPLLILDDIGAERPTEWARERITQLIGNRYDNERCTLVSSNLTLPELKEHIDPIGRITSRIAGMTIPMEYKGVDKRNKL